MLPTPKPNAVRNDVKLREGNALFHQIVKVCVEVVSSSSKNNKTPMYIHADCNFLLCSSSRQRSSQTALGWRGQLTFEPI